LEPVELAASGPQVRKALQAWRLVRDYFSRLARRSVASSRLALMNGNPITIGIGYKRKGTDRRLNIVCKKPNAGLLQIRNGLFKIVDFKRNGRAALAGWFPSVGYGECNITDFILYQYLPGMPSNS